MPGKQSGKCGKRYCKDSRKHGCSGASFMAHMDTVEPGMGKNP